MIRKNENNRSFYMLFPLTDSCPDGAKQVSYREFIQKEITSRVSSCPQSLFIFDEMDKLPIGLIDAISAFLDHSDSIDGVDFRLVAWLRECVLFVRLCIVC